MNISEARTRFRRRLQAMILDVQAGKEKDLPKARTLAQLYNSLLSYYAAEEKADLEVRIAALEAIASKGVDHAAFSSWKG